MTKQEKMKEILENKLKNEYNEERKKESKLKYSSLYYDGSICSSNHWSRDEENNYSRANFGMFIKMINEETVFGKKEFPKFSFTQIIIIALAYHIIVAINNVTSNIPC